MTKELILMLCEAGKNELERTFAAVPDDKLSWQPAEGARSALDAFSQAAQSTQMTVMMMQAGQGGMEGMEGMNIREMMGRMAAERAGWSRQDALTHMETGWSAFKASLEPLTDEQLEAPLTLPMGGGTTAPSRFGS